MGMERQSAYQLIEASQVTRRLEEAQVAIWLKVIESQRSPQKT